ncbi:MAG: phosphopantothenoylcysteine decarboxylase, partial [Pseudomonadota bacterium]
SGKMGFAVAEAARDAGAEVTLISGPTHLEPPDQVFVEKVITAQEMYQSVMRRCPEIDIFIGAAAVADYRAVAQNPEKIKKTAAALTLELVRNEDILAAVAEQQPGPFTVGFAAETEKLLVHARDKLVRKGIDMIAANWVGQGRGFNTDDNELVVVWSDGEVELDRQPKGPLARHLVAIVAERYRAVTCPEV